MDRVEELQVSTNAFYGYFRNDELTMKSSSGGAAAALYRAFLYKNGVVFGAVYSSDFKSAHFSYSESIEDIDKFLTSKYISTEKIVHDDSGCSSVFEKVALFLNNKKRVLFIGLGCDVAALFSYLKSKKVNYDHLYTVDLICHGPTYSEVQKQFIESLEKKYKSHVVSFNVRYKKLGWTPPFIRAEFENGKTFVTRFYDTDFGFAFKAYSRQSCYQCRFKGNNHLADLTIGDYWGCKPGVSGYNAKGVSIIFCRSIKGQYLLEMLKRLEGFVISEADIDLAIKSNPMYITTRKKDEVTYNLFDKMFKSYGLHYAVSHSEGYNSFRKNAIRNIIKDHIPQSIKKVIHRT